jgi:hypothetical protein
MQAQVLLLEAEQGHPEHLLLAIGHLGEAADEIVAIDSIMADEIRSRRKILESSGKVRDLLELAILIKENNDGRV